MGGLGVGVWAGPARRDTSSVLPAAYSFSNEAGDDATIVKLAPATFIIPSCLVYVYREVRRHRKAGGRLSIRRLIPWFIIWFVCASLVRSTGLLPAELLSILSHAAKFLMVLALAAIGLSSNMRTMARAGWQPLVLGLGTWFAVATTSLGVQNFSGAW